MRALCTRFAPALTLFCVFAVACVAGGCAGTGKIDTPTTVSNAGGAAGVTYAVAGKYASYYFALDVCATPPVYPCKVMSVNNKLLEVDTAAYNAAKAANAVGATQVQRDNAAAKLAELNRANADPAVRAQVDLAKSKEGGTL